MLTEEDKNYMIEVLSVQLSGSGTPRQDMVTPLFGTDFAKDLKGDTPRLLAIDAVSLCISNGWNNNPTWLETIIQAFALEIQDPKVAVILERLKHRPPPAANQLTRSILPNGSPFVNRHFFRTTVDRLSNSASNTQPILVITGDSKTGKSYSHNFITHFSSIRPPGSVNVYRYEFDNEMGLQVGPVEVAKDLVSKMARALVNLPGLETNLKLYSRQLALWVLNEAAQTPAQHWFVLDNFHGDKLRQDTKDFIIALTDNVTTGIFQQRCRIILIGFDPGSLTVDPGQYEEQFVEKCTVADIRISIEEILSHSPVVLDYAKVAPFVTDSLPPPPDKMYELNMRLRALWMAIDKLTPILKDNAAINFGEVLMSMLKELPPAKEKISQLKKRLQLLTETVNEMP